MALVTFAFMQYCIHITRWQDKFQLCLPVKPTNLLSVPSRVVDTFCKTLPFLLVAYILYWKKKVNKLPLLFLLHSIIGLLDLEEKEEQYLAVEMLFQRLNYQATRSKLDSVSELNH